MTAAYESEATWTGRQRGVQVAGIAWSIIMPSCEADLLHHDSVVALKGDINIHVGLHGADLVGCQEALAPTTLAALLQDVHPAPGGGCLQPTGQHMDGLPILGIPFCC